MKSLEEMENERARLAADAEQYERRMAQRTIPGRMMRKFVRARALIIR